MTTFDLSLRNKSGGQLHESKRVCLLFHRGRRGSSSRATEECDIYTDGL